VLIKYSGKGDESPSGGSPGDLYVKISVAASDVFYRKGDDLYYTAPMTIFDLVLGGKITIPHPE
jgi:DnaJ-class molecular chaperone